MNHQTIAGAMLLLLAMGHSCAAGDFRLTDAHRRVVKELLTYG